MSLFGAGLKINLVYSWEDTPALKLSVFAESEPLTAF